MVNTGIGHNIREKRQLVFSRGRIIEGIHIQGKLAEWFVKGSDKLIDECVLKPNKRANTSRISEPRKRWLTCQIWIVSRPITDQLKDGVTF